MKEIKVLDCTLRDGGYCNNWKFGKRNIERILTSLRDAGIQTVEYGYLNVNCNLDEGSTQVSSIDAVPVIDGIESILMINYGSVDICHIPVKTDAVKSFRVAFHKKDREDALQFCKQLMEKGYQVYVQPMVTNSYTLEEYTTLLEAVKRMNPFAFYIVDSFGSMYDIEIKEYLKLADEMLQSEIILGFHGHDNSRLAFDNAKTMIENCRKHAIYIDSSIMGMGRGAGNLSTEIIVEYCNRHWHSGYVIQPLLKVIDEVMNYFYQDRPWGYSLVYYLAAKYNCHPNYAKYLDDKKTLTVSNMDDIFQKLSVDKKVCFDRNYIENVYQNYMEKGICDDTNGQIWKAQIENRNILLLAPGNSIAVHEESINTYIKEKNPVIISINFDYKRYPVDYIFFSNLRRYHEWLEKRVDHQKKLILTSNISAEEYFLKINYSELLSEENMVRDNAGLMAIRFLCQNQIKEIALAGYDGYQYEDWLNYVDREMKIDSIGEKKHELNTFIKAELEKLEDKVELKYLTPTIYKEKEKL